MIHEQNEKFNKEIEIIRRNQILELKNLMKERKNAVERISIRMDQAEE